jgi:hypothetical protein
MAAPQGRVARAVSDRKHWLDYATAVFAFVAAVAACVAAGMASHQNSIASDSERRQLRAYVSMVAISLEAGRHNGGEMVWNTEAVWRNSGATPARGLQVFSNIAATYAKGPTLSTSGPEPILDLAPHDEAFIWGSSVPTSKIQSFVARGVAVYRDAFGHDRVTLACRTANLFDPEVLNTVKAGDKVTLNSRPCGADSCADEDCKAFRDKIGDKAPASAYEP